MPWTSLKQLVAPLAVILLAGILIVVFAPRTSSVGKPRQAIPQTVRIEPVFRSATTTSGDPIVAPEGKLQTVVSKYHIASRASLPAHKHPYPRYGYVLSGSLMVTNIETRRSAVFNAGDVIVEDVGRWHEARNLQAQPVDLLVIDLIKPAASNVILRK